MAFLPSKRIGNNIRGALFLLLGLAQLYFKHFRPSNRSTETPFYGVALLLIAAFFFYRATVPEGLTSLFGSQRN